MVGPALRHTARHLGQLRADHGGRQVLHAHVVQRQLVLPVAKAVLQAGVLLPVFFIGTGHDHGAGGQFRIVRYQDAALACIDQLVGLEAEAADLADGADVAARPGGAQRMRGIFDHRNAARIAQRHDRIHVAGMAAHMADQHRLRIVQLGCQIGDIDTVVAAHLDKDRNAVCMNYGRGDGGEGEGGDQYLGTLRQIKRLDRNEQRSRTG